MIESRSGKPFINVMFGNFYCPGYDDKEFVKDTIRFIKNLGFNSVMLDTKDSEDYRERIELKEKPSQYVEMQEYMEREVVSEGLSYNFLLLYLNGDNLYPHIRFSPPVIGERIEYIDGTKAMYYKYWSPKTQEVMVEHVKEILSTYPEGLSKCKVNGKTGYPICTMWDPIVAVSFDEEGINRYRSFLQKEYKDDTELINKRYGLNLKNIDEIAPYEYWYSLVFGEEKITEQDVKGKSNKYWILRDNRLFQITELQLYFKNMQERLKKVVPDIITAPTLTQWGYFMNIDGKSQADIDNDYSDLWDTSIRGVDYYRIAPFVDMCHFITVPVTDSGYPDAYVTSLQHSMMRMMNPDREWIGGIYWGRYIYRDLYEYLTPEEIIGSMVAQGVFGYSSYGINGLDDGGVLNRVEPYVLDSLKRGNEWLSNVVPKRKGKKKKEIAILFPLEMSDFEGFEVENNSIRRLDLLGWYKCVSDLGYQVDVISTYDIKKDALNQYFALIVPCNSWYGAMEHYESEKKIQDFVCNGGLLIHGPDDELACRCFGIEQEQNTKMPFRYKNQKYIVPQGASFVSYKLVKAEVIAKYKNGKACVISTHVGEGEVVSIGFMLGSSYTAKNIPHVPYDEGNREMYPLVLSGSTMIRDILYSKQEPYSCIREKGIEVGVYGNGMVVVNHRSVPFKLPKQYTQQIDGGFLGGHSSAWVEFQ
ncbi:MAG: hypothetical protein E7309_04365 [Butyrivibrio sp.]|jgi:hypothetical protein|nr:hypothetical protein [Butyrivibrio sp.]